VSLTTSKRASAAVAIALLCPFAWESRARADDCAALGGVLEPGVGCVVSTPVVRHDAAVSDGSFDLDESLIVEREGRITVPAASGGNSLTINVAGDLIVQPGGGIVGDASGAGPATGIGATLRFAVAGSIDLTGDGATGGLISSSHTSGSCTGGEAGTIVLAAGGSFTASTGATLAANSRLCKAGDITITAGGTVFIDGLVASGPSTTLKSNLLSGNKVLKGDVSIGGTIVVRSAATEEFGITVGSHGILVSQGTQVSSGIILEACGIRIHGLVASQAPKRTPVRSNVLVRSKGGIVVDGSDLGTTNDRQGRIRADGLGAGVLTSESEIPRADVIARGDIVVRGPASGTLFAVTSNPGLGIEQPPGGTIRVVSLEGTVVSNGNVFEAGRNKPGLAGGMVSVSAAETIDFTKATITATGDFNQSGGFGAGGTIGVRSFNGAVIWRNGIGDVRPSGDDTPEADRGSVLLTACTDVDAAGTFPYIPPVGGPVTPTVVLGECSEGSPPLPSDVKPVGKCRCSDASDCVDGNACNGSETCSVETGLCVVGTPLTCDDGNVCNGSESCDAEAGCQPGTPLTCDDGNVCNGSESCDAEAGCQPSTPLTCDDGDVCNGSESCDPATGCQPGMPLTCDDGDVCNGSESCDAEAGCRPGVALRCDDGNACNGVETCDPQARCRTGTPPTCDDGDVCNGGETCDPRIGCVPICALEATDCSSTRLPDGTPCGDGDSCNGEEICQEGSCIVPSPAAALACANASLAYVITNFDDGTVSVLNDPAAPTIPVGRAPWGVAIHPLRTYAYVTNREDNTLSVIETATWTVTTTVPVGQLPLGVAVDPPGTLVYVTSFDDDTITMIDTRTHTVIGRVSAGPGPAGLAFNAAGTHLYVTNFAARTISVFDPATSTLIDTLTVGEQPLDITVDPVHNRAYVSNFDSRDVSVIGLLSSTVLTTLEVGNRPFGIGVSGPLGLALVANGADDSVSVIDTPTSTVIGTIAVGNGPLGVTFDLTGERAYVVNNEDGTVSIIDTAAAALLATERVGNQPVAFGRFAGSVTDRCGAPELGCDDNNPFTADACGASTRCTHTPLSGLIAASAGLAAMDTTVNSAPIGALGNPRKSERLDKLVVAARTALRLTEVSQVTTTDSDRKTRKRQKRARRRLARLIRLVKQGIRRGTVQRDVGWRLLDLARATHRVLGRAKGASPAVAIGAAAAPRRARPDPPPPRFSGTR
jgi:YVTN family beta-propeller protein